MKPSRQQTDRSPGAPPSLTLAGRRFTVVTLMFNMTELAQRLDGNFGLILSAETGDPLVVVRLRDFLHHCQIRRTNKTPLTSDTRKPEGAR